MVQVIILFVSAILFTSFTIILTVRLYSLQGSVPFTSHDECSARISSLRVALILPTFAVLSIIKFGFWQNHQLLFLLDGIEGIVEGYCILSFFNAVLFRTSNNRKFILTLPKELPCCSLHRFACYQIGVHQFLVFRPMIIVLRGGLQLLHDQRLALFVVVLFMFQLLSVCCVIVTIVSLVRFTQPSRGLLAQFIFCKAIVFLVVIQNGIELMRTGHNNSFFPALLSFECFLFSCGLQFVFAITGTSTETTPEKLENVPVAWDLEHAVVPIELCEGHKARWPPKRAVRGAKGRRAGTLAKSTSC